MSHWLEVHGNPTVGWRVEGDPLVEAAEAVVETGRPCVIHEPGCKRGTGMDPFGDGKCRCTPFTVQPEARA